MKIIDVEQGSLEWHKLRVGKITGSKFKSLISAKWLELLDLIASEIVTGANEDSDYVSDAMQWGIDNEQLAIDRYESETFNTCRKVGFCMSDKYPFLGFSPDRLVGDTGAVEVKCPSSKVHMKYIRQGKLPPEYTGQVLAYFTIHKELEWLDFVSYDPKNPVDIWVLRVNRDELNEKLKLVSERLEKFSIELEKTLEKFKR